MASHFEDITGHAFQKKVLRRTAGAGRAHHAYVFSGPEGVGKKLMALGFAKLLNCAAEGGGEAEGPCPCLACSKIARGIHPDVMTVEHSGQYVIKVEQVREEVERRIQSSPFEGRVKVAIVDDAHRMNASAQNAFLKTLEEPPGDTVIILVTSKPEGLLPTIRSRCQPLEFDPLEPEEIAGVLEAERGYPPEEARLVARLARGSLGAALDFDTELLGFRTEAALRLSKLDPRSAADVLGFVETLPTGSGKEEGARLEFFFALLSSLFHDALLHSTGAGSQAFFNPDLAGVVTALAEHSSTRELAQKQKLIDSTTAAVFLGNANRTIALEHLLVTLTG